MWTQLRDAVRDAWAVLAPTECAGCGAHDRGLCDTCRAALEAAPVVREALVRADGSELPVWRAFEYDGVGRSILLAFKDGGRTDAGPALAAALRRSIRAALTELPAQARGRVVLAAIPSTRAAFRRRGYRHVPLLLARAGYRDSRLLRATRQTRDQSDLDTTSRFANRAESLTVRRGVAHPFVLLVDDIVTTGATLLEADRAFREAGLTVIGAAALARTQRRFPKLKDTGAIGRKGP